MVVGVCMMKQGYFVVQGYLLGAEFVFNEIQPWMRATRKCRHRGNMIKCLDIRYEIQSGVHDPYEDCVAALRLYKRLRFEKHQSNEESTRSSSRLAAFEVKKKSNFELVSAHELLKKSSGELLRMSTPNYRCWCLDGVVHS